jgi:hypothetical protein
MNWSDKLAWAWLAQAKTSVKKFSLGMGLVGFAPTRFLSLWRRTRQPEVSQLMDRE